MFGRLKAYLAAGAAFSCAMATVWALASFGADAVRADEPLVPNAKVTIKQAIRAAEAEGGRVETARFSAAGGGRWAIGVRRGAGAETMTVYVDPNTGEVAGEAPAKPTLAIATPAAAAESKPASAADGGLAKAVALAEKRTNGAAFEAQAQGDGAFLISLSTLVGRKDMRVTAAGEVTER